ncbi:MAG TPA: hypothetical protein VJN88_11600, partial [Ktedonobacterales bacterium]|nr:hypothetical protein [Ktedonobacterales bacterium]
MIPNESAPVAGVDELTARKLEAFDRLERTFEASFAYLRDMHGERRFAALPLERTVAYLHALWVCECKDWLLSVPKTIARYEGGASLQALRAWQQGDEATVSALLERKLDGMSFATLSRRLREARDAGDTARAKRLAHGRGILLNRAYNLNAALDAIFAATPEEAARQVSEASARYGHAPDAIERQLADFKTPLYSYAPHPALARRNIQVMNRLGVRATGSDADRPGERTANVEAPTLPLAPYAQEVIVNEHTLSSMADNNPAHLDLAMPPLDLDD